MKRLHLTISLFLLLCFGFVSGQINQDSLASYRSSIEKYRTGINIKFMYSDKTPLKPAQQKVFKGLNYFPVDMQYLIRGKLTKNQETERIVMRTSTERAPEYNEYGFVEFEFDGEKYSLAVYQELGQLFKEKENKNLFIPFRDETNGIETYGGGRYIESKIPDSANILLLDFNKAYNPYCAYNSRFSCVIPPEENRLPIRIEAGEKIFEAH